MSTNPIAVGIDLGTTNSVVAVAQGGQPRVLTTAEGMALIPSVVSFTASGQTLVGAAARSARTTDPENTIFSVKRLMGRPFDAEEVRRAAARFAFSLERGPEQSVVVRTRAGTHTLPELSALVLREVRRVAESALGQQLGRAVITVPANFNELQRSATKLAGQIADLDVARILNEPTAAALAYGYGRGTKERIAVYDFGGGTFDVTLLELSGNVFEVLATAGDTFLGGDDIDASMAEGLADAATKTLRFDARKDRKAYEMLRLAAEQAKIDLSVSEAAQIRIPSIGVGAGGRPLEFRSRITRGEFETVAQPFVQRTVDVCAEAMRLAGLKPQDFGAIILVGGSSQIPLVRRAVRDFFKAEPHTSLPPDTVVATGAAVLAEALGGKRTKITGHSKVGKIPSAPPPGASLPPGTSDPNMPAVAAPLNSPSSSPVASNTDFPAVKGGIPGPPAAPQTTPLGGTGISNTSLPAVKGAGMPAPPPPPVPTGSAGSNLGLPAVKATTGPGPSSRQPTDPGVGITPAPAPQPQQKVPSNLGLPAVKGSSGEQARQNMRKTGDLGITPPKPPVPAVAPRDAAGTSVTGLPAVKGAGGARVPPPPPNAFPTSGPDTDAETPTGTGLPALSKTPSQQAFSSLDDDARLPAVAVPGAPQQRPRVSTEPHGITREELQENAKPEFSAPRMRTRTITSAAAAVPPPAPTPAGGLNLPQVAARAPVGPATPSSIAPPKPSDFTWSSPSERPGALKPNALVPLDEDDEEIHTAIKTPKQLDEEFPDSPTGMYNEQHKIPSVTDLPATSSGQANLPANVAPAATASAPAAGRGPAKFDAPIMPSHRITKSLVDLPEVAPPKPPTDLPSVAGSNLPSTALNSKIPTLTQVDGQVMDSIGLPSAIGSNIATQPSISTAGLEQNISAKPALPEPNDGVTTLKRISTLITEAEDTDHNLPAVSAPKTIDRAPQPPPPPPLAPQAPPQNPSVVGRRTAVMLAAAPPPPPVMSPPPPPPPPIAPPPPPAPVSATTQPGGSSFDLNGEASLLTSPRDLFATLGFDNTAAPEPAPPPVSLAQSNTNNQYRQPEPPPPPLSMPSALSTAPIMGGSPSPSAMAPNVPTTSGPPLRPAAPTPPFAQQPPPPPPVAMQAPPPPPAPYTPPYNPPPSNAGQGFGSPMSAPMPAFAPPPPTNRGAPIAPPVAPLLLDVTPQSLRVETVGGLSQMVIGRNSTIPLEQTREFATAYDNQADVRIRIAQGESNKFAENQPLGELELVGLRPAPRGEVRIAVTFELDADGTLQIRARDTMTGLQTEARINLLTIPTAPATEAMAQRQRGN